MYNAVKAKFEQNENPKGYLLATVSLTLGEASTNLSGVLVLNLETHNL